MAKQKPLKTELFDEPYRFEFFQAVRLLEKIYPDKKAVGQEAMPHEEMVRFRSRVSFDFPASEIQKIEESFDELNDEKKLEMYVNFMGMVGMNGVMPLPYTELVISRARYKDTAMWSFLDIFSHRMISMFFRAWEKYRFPVGYERGQDKFTSYLFDFVGLGTNGLRGRMSLEDESLLPYSGLIAQKPHSSNALENILSDYFGVKAKVLQFFGQWLDLDKESYTKLGSANSDLSRSAIIGTRIWDQQSKFRIVIGAMSFKQFQAFLPNGSAHEALKSIVRFMTTRAKRRPMLGWSSWLKTEPFAEDDDQVILQIS